MRTIDTPTLTALQSGSLVLRDFVWIVGKNRSTGVDESIGISNDSHDMSVQVIDGISGSVVTRTYIGGGALPLSISPIPLVSDLTIRSVRITLSQISSAIDTAIRQYDPRFAHVEIHRGLFDPATRALIAPPYPHFVGQMNGAPITTPAVGGEGSVEVTVVSHSRELTRTNAAKKSDETQRRRGGDRFRRYSDVAKEWNIPWGNPDGRKGD